MIEVRALNSRGIRVFQEWLQNPVGEAPRHLISDDEYSKARSQENRVDELRKFQTTFDLGKYLSSDVFDLTANPYQLYSEDGLWEWLSLVYIDDLLARRGGRTTGRPLKTPHYVHESHRNAYRLMCRTAWDLYRLHGENARVALGSLQSPWGEMAEQMTSRQEIYSHPMFWLVANRLYLDASGSLKSGASGKRDERARMDPKSTAGLGGIRRLPFTFKQFERTYNLREMSVNDVVALLPPEYQRWLK